MSIAENIASVQKQIAEYPCQLIAVSKAKPIDMLMEAYQAGIRNFGENKVQELTDKYDAMPKDIKWHMIGHLQRNKVKYIVPFVHLIHAVDSLRLLKEIEKQAKKVDRVVDCLLQIHIAKEETKFGFSEEELFDALNSSEIRKLEYVRVLGLMGMATFTDNDEQVRKEFAYLKQLFDSVKDKPDLPDYVQLQELSMGMSGDFEIALAEGSTMVRIGTTIFGERSSRF